jgi:hypothetical protein
MPRNPSSLVGVGGWLTLLIVVLTILGPLRGLSQMINEFQATEKAFPNLAANAAWLQYKQISWMIFAITAAISISAGYRLWKIHVHKSVRFAILALWLVGPVGNTAYIIAAVVSFGSIASADMLPDMVGSLIGSGIVAVIWTAYLIRSLIHAAANFASFFAFRGLSINERTRWRIV